MSKREIAEELFLKGFNCAQAVAGAFSDEAGIDFDLLVKIASPFGGGMGRLREVCGTVSGMFLIVGMLYGYNTPRDIEAKKELYMRVQTLAFGFKEQNGSYICRELLGLKSTGADSPVPEARTDEYYKKRPCMKLAGDAAEILEKYIAEHPVSP